jgi:hypothetical protein
MLSRLKKVVRNYPGELLLLALFIAGLILIISPLYWRWELDHGVSLALGTALLTSCIVTVTVELWMSRRIARNVFKAAFGYPMPDHFQREILRIADQRLISRRHIVYMKITPLCGGEMVSVDITTHREITNIGPRSESITPQLHLDEWGFPTRSRITKVEIQRNGAISSAGYEEMKRLEDSTVLVQMPPIDINPEETVTAITQGTEIRRINDHIMMGFLTPAENPIIHLEYPQDKLIVVPDPGIVKGKGVKKTAVPNQYEFVGVYFPPAHMRVRWWPKADQL